MELKDLRNEIDQIDDELVKLFTHRMEICSKVAGVKKEKSLPIFVPEREQKKLADVAKKAGPEMANYTRVLYSTLFELSRSYQNRLNGSRSPLHQQITDSIERTPNRFPQNAVVACLEAEGAYSQIASEKLFENPSVINFQNIEEIVSAIDTGLCQYAVLPIETPTAGSVQKVYDLIIDHHYSIVRTLRMTIDHNLPANQENNSIRYICISKNMEIYPDSDRTSLILVLPNSTGSLYKFLARLYALGINVRKLEARSVPDRVSEIMFYFELESTFHNNGFVHPLCELGNPCEDFKYLGSYREIMS